jgi:hypothetical protein
MNPSATNERATINLPSPVAEQAPESPAVNAPASAPESLTGGPESAAQTAPAPLLNLPVQLPVLPTDPVVTAQSDDTTTTNIVVPNAADDTDLIEKDWVIKAKKIVENTLEDPYEQSKELTVFKADYMKKRYNKTIKLSE